MAFSDLVRLWKHSRRYPKGTSDRYIEMDCRQRLLDGTIFEILSYSFDQEYIGQGPDSYISINKRRPSVIFNLAKIIVEQSASLVFGEQHAPSVRLATDDSDADISDDESEKRDAALHNLYERVTEVSELDSVMLEAMQKGSSGSVAIVLRRLPDGTPWLDTIETKGCKPIFNAADPRVLDRMIYIYSMSAEDLIMAGYGEEYDDEEMYWLRIDFTIEGEVRSFPMKESRYEKLGQEDSEGHVITWVRDDDNSHRNPFHFMNVLWVRNLEERRLPDGKSSFRDIADFMIEISYHLSQAGRGFRYTADPLLAISEGELSNVNPLMGYATDGGDAIQTKRFDRSTTRALSLPAGSEAKMLEISGQGLASMDVHVKLLREYALEIISGMKSDSEHTSGVQSGKALHYLHQALLWLVERLRVSYGQRGYLPLLLMMLTAIVDGDLTIAGVDAGLIDLDHPLRLIWPQWMNPTGQDLFQEIQAVNLAAGGSVQVPVQLLPKDIAAQVTAAKLGISDTNRSVSQLKRERGDKDNVLPQDLARAQISQIETNNEVALNPPTPAKPSNSK